MATGLTLRQEKAAMALAEGKTLKEAAEAAGVSDKTIKNWKHEPLFMARINEKKAELADEYDKEWLEKITKRAKEVIETNLDNKNPWIAMRAAEKVLDMIEKKKTANDQIQVVFTQAPAPALPKSYDTIVGTIDET